MLDRKQIATRKVIMCMLKIMADIYSMRFHFDQVNFVDKLIPGAESPPLYHTLL